MQGGKIKFTFWLIAILASFQLTAAEKRDESYLYFSGGLSDVQVFPTGSGYPSFAMEYLSAKGQLKWGPLYFQPTFGAEVNAYPTISTFAGETLSLYTTHNQYISIFAGPAVSLDMRSMSTPGAFPLELRAALELGYSPPGKVRVGLQIPGYFQYNQLSKVRIGGAAFFLAIPFGSSKKPATNTLTQSVAKWNY